MRRTWIKNISILAWFAITLLTGCRAEKEIGDLQQEQTSGKNINLNFSIIVPDMTKVETRAVDEDAIGVETICLFCFDKNGLLITMTTTSSHTPGKPNEAGYYLEGTFTAEVPNYTKIIHLVANQNIDSFNETEWLGKSEAEVMTSLTATSNRMIYWGRVEAEDNEEISEAMKRISNAGDSGKQGIVMIRNQAKVTVKALPDANFTLSEAGFIVCNTNAFGTIAPYNRTTNQFDWRTAQTKYITLPTETARTTDPQDVVKQNVQYIFETENNLSSPVSVIIKGRNNNETEDRYYRVLIQDTDGNLLPILRNHHYEIQVTGTLSYGYATFAEALKGAATNNIWISIADEIKTVSDGENTLTVENTFVVTEGQDKSTPLTLKYTYTEEGNSQPESPVVSWGTENNNVASTSITNNYDPATGQGTIQVTLLPMEGNTKREGTLLIKKGKLQRSIKIIAVKKMTFTPAWVSTGIYQTANKQKATIMFTIPEECPDELMPIRVLISVNHMDVRNESGMKLSVITKANSAEEYSGDWNDEDIKYKYVYEAKHKGTQRIYLETVLPDNVPDNAKIEAQFFQTLTKQFTYSNEQKVITLEGLQSYNGSEAGEEFAKDEVIYYKLVPRKINAFVDFTIGIKNNGTDAAIPIGENDEFLLYSQYLNAYNESDFPINGVAAPDCIFGAVDQDQWNSEGRVFYFYPKNNNGNDMTKKVYMYTNRPNSAEVIRIASNQEGNTSVKGTEEYKGEVYRSIVFELANYNPFKFASTIKDSDTKEQKWTYEYEQPVDIKFNIASFVGSDKATVDPFGTSFKVFIDAPMLKIDESRRPQGVDENKFYQDTDGRFVYVVDKDADTESKFFKGTLKTLHFKTNKIVSAGDITISADKNIVDFETETYSITNQSISGTIQYGTGINVEPNAFVAFKRDRDQTRIGRINVKQNGEYDLVLYGEYSYAWNGDEHITMQYTRADGIYEAKIYNLATLFKNPNVILKKLE